jgi:hypothetical protein
MLQDCPSFLILVMSRIASHELSKDGRDPHPAKMRESNATRLSLFCDFCYKQDSSSRAIERWTGHPF